MWIFIQNDAPGDIVVEFAEHASQVTLETFDKVMTIPTCQTGSHLEVLYDTD